VGRPRVGESELTRATIVAAALKILDAQGLEALSLARIASALKVQTPALYWDFSNKAELYTYMADAMFRDVLSALDPSLNGRELLWAFGRAKRANLRTRRDAAKLISIAGVSDEIRNDLVPALLSRVTGSDMTLVQARHTLTAIQALAVGWAVFEANPATSEVMRYSNDGDSAFEEALTQLVFGKVPRKVG
jgi:TetR/AcrR family transcriptional regulator, tetracycline repressor protein